MNEADFFGRIANRLGRSTTEVTPPRRNVVGAPDFWSSYQLGGVELIEKFASELELLGGTAQVYDTKDALVRGLEGLLEALHPNSVSTWGGPFMEEYGLAALADAYDVVPWGNGAEEMGEGADTADMAADRVSDLVADRTAIRKAAVAEVGITGCDYAIADTGTVVLVSSPSHGRSVSLLPTVHIVIVKESQIRTRMGEVWAELGEKGQSTSCINFVSGPSRSSDIENDLSIGVHGPAAVYALVWRDMAG